MAVSRVQTSSIVQGFPKSRSLLAGNPTYIPPSFESIATYSLAGLSDVTFSSIPSSYKHLQLRFIGTNGAQNTAFLTFNGDTTSGNYRNHALAANGSSVVTYSTFGYSQIVGQYYGVSNNNSYLSGAVVDIIDYASTTKNKTVRGINGYDQNGSGHIELMSTLWMSTSAINSIKVEISSVAFATGSSIALYGIKG